MQPRTLSQCRDIEGVSRFSFLVSGARSNLRAASRATRNKKRETRLGRLAFCSAVTTILLITCSQKSLASETQKALSRFQTAEQLLSELKSKPVATRTRNDYLRVINTYREVHHLAPTSTRADPSAYEVAELTEQMGRRFNDGSVLAEAVKHYRFLLHEYPATKHRFEALLAIGDIEAGDLHDPEAARAAYQEFLKRFPNHALAAEARQRLTALDSSAGRKQAKRTPDSADSPAASATQVKPVTEVNLPNSDDTASQPAVGPVVIRGIRHWSTSEYTRIAIDVDQQVQYEIGEVPGPERVFFDLKNAKLATGAAEKTYDINDGLVRRVRVASYNAHTARVVVELIRSTDYTPFILPNPWRIMVEFRPHAASASTAQPKTSPQQIVAEPFSLDGPKPATPPAASSAATTKPADDAESMVIFVPMKTSAKTGSTTESPSGKTTANAAPGAEGTASSEQAHSASASTPVEIAKNNASRDKGRAADATADSPSKNSTPPGARTRRAQADDAIRPREAQPTSNGERSLTRVLGLKIGRIVIDAGHGGHDTGTVGPNGYCEKDLVLDVALRLGKLLESKMGAEVIYTREDDTFIPLEERTAIANRASADLFLSIHANSSSDPSARGVETYYLNFSASDESLEVAARENATSQKTVYELQDLVKNIALKEKIDESREFAAEVQHFLWAGEAAKSPGIRNRGVKKAPFIVLIGAHMPSVLAEISFVSNPGDERRLRTPEYRQRIAESLYKGISRYAGGLSGVKLAANTAAKPSGGVASSAQPSH